MTSQLENGSFQVPKVKDLWGSVADSRDPQIADHCPGWLTTDRRGEIEIWGSGHEQVRSADGGQFAEINTSTRSTLYQDLQTEPGTTMHWRLLHRGRSDKGADTMAVLIGTEHKLTEQAYVSDGQAWGEHRGSYVIPAGQTTTRFAFTSVSVASGDESIGNFLDAVVFSTSPIADELAPITHYDKGEIIVPRAELATDAYMILHHVSGHYVITDAETVSASQAIQTWNNFPLKTGATVLGYLWHFEKYGTEKDDYLIRTHMTSAAEEAPLYLEASKATLASRLEYPRIQPRTKDGSVGPDLQVWTVGPMTSDPNTYTIRPKAFAGTHALGGLGGNDTGDTYVVLTPTYGTPTFQHCWSLAKQATTSSPKAAA